MQHEKQIELHLIAMLDHGITIEQVFEIVPLAMLMDGAPTLSQIPALVSYYEIIVKKRKEKKRLSLNNAC